MQPKLEAVRYELQIEAKAWNVTKLTLAINAEGGIYMNRAEQQVKAQGLRIYDSMMMNPFNKRGALTAVT